jgi:hypothetical protein
MSYEHLTQLSEIEISAKREVIWLTKSLTRYSNFASGEMKPTPNGAYIRLEDVQELLITLGLTNVK